ncbi:MAG: sensor histidine kinase N-terminal domain-containing protein [Alphaproteobacteria bacterium]|nr:sensor histidine kinase N-terminal domain-containing protein [Alphaproteobacteria bacterium]
MLLAAGWSLAVVVLAGFALSAYFRHAALQRFDASLSEAVDSLVAEVAVENGQVQPPPVVDPRSLRAYSGSYWEIAPVVGGHIQAELRSRSLWDHTLSPPADVLARTARSPGDVTFYDAIGPLNRPLRVAAMQGRLPELPQPVLFMAAEDRTPVDAAVRAFAAAIAVSLAVLGAGLSLAVFLQVRVGLSPLFALRREMAAVRVGESERITGDYPSELAPLAEELNALMRHTQETVERQRTHVGNLAHALKTPLSVILTEARAHPGPLAEVVLRQGETMGQQVDHHLRRARAAARAQGPGERTEVGPALDELARTLERIFSDTVSEVDWRCDPGLSFLGERQDLLELAGNVMENACKWCRSYVRVTATAEGPRQLRLVVEDDGPGLAPEQRSEVVRRGARLDERTPGSGLGLSIVDELVRAYGGALELGASPLGGLSVEMRLPRAER